MKAQWILLIAFGAACKGNPGPAKGVLDGPCQDDGSCDLGLTCLVDTCLLVTPDANVPPPPPPPPPPLDTAAMNQLIGDPISDLDILVVVDGSGSMREEQESLRASFGEVITVLKSTFGELPNLHLGIVSADLGAGPYGIMGCTGEGDKGVLQNIPSGACEVPSPERFIIDIADEGGSGRTTNFTGTLEDTFSCIAELGTGGCGFEQTLESMRRALDGSNIENDGFVRPEAALAILVLTDEDDCSAKDLSVYDSDPTLDNVESALGPLSSFRCFEFGVVCEPDTPRVIGNYENCVSREDSVFMYPMAEYAEFLLGIKDLPGRVHFSVIAGAGTVTVDERDGEPNLVSGCTSASGDADPAIRIATLSGLLGMPPAESICNTDLSGPLTGFGQNVAAMLSGNCLTAALSSECRVLDISAYGTDTENVEQELPSCADSDTGACWSATTDSPNCLGGSGVEISIDRRGTTVPTNSVVIASCPN